MQLNSANKRKLNLCLFDLVSSMDIIFLPNTLAGIYYHLEYLDDGSVEDHLYIRYKKSFELHEVDLS